MSGYSAPRPIGEHDVVADFDSGEPTLDKYLRGRALANHVEGASRCFVTCRDGRVVGFYALASAAVERRGTPGRVRRNMPDPVPVILLSRLAIDRKEQGKGWDLPPCVGHAQSQECPGGSEMIQPDGKEELSR